MDIPGSFTANGVVTSSTRSPARERVRTQFLDLAISIGKEHQAEGRSERARAVYLRGLDSYPDSARIHQSLIADSLDRNLRAPLAALTATDACTAVTGSAASRSPRAAACTRPRSFSGAPGGRVSSTCCTFVAV